MTFRAVVAISGVALAIAVGLLLYLRAQHPFVRVPLWRVVIFFLYGAVIAPVLAIAPEAAAELAGIGLSTPCGAFLVIGPVEEVAKAAGALLLVALVRPWREEPFEWMLACAAAGTGFAMTENVLYSTLLYHEEAFQVLALRSAAPMHLVWSAMIGYRIGCRNPGAGGFLRAAIVAFVLASFLHGLWDALCFTGLVGLLLVLFGGQIFAFGWHIRRMTWLCANRSPRRPDVHADAEAAPRGPSPVVCTECSCAFETVRLRDAELSSCPGCGLSALGRHDLYRLVTVYAGAPGWFPMDVWYRFYWSEGEGTMACATCRQHVPTRQFLGYNEPRLAVCSDCAMVTAYRKGLLQMPACSAPGSRGATRDHGAHGSLTTENTESTEKT